MHFVVKQARAEGASRWELQALGSLFPVAAAIQLAGPDCSSYINGQHRAQALIDAGVRHTVVLWLDEPEIA